MLPFNGSRLPDSHDALRDAITRGLAHYGVIAREVRAEGNTWPMISCLAVDVSGAHVSRDLRFPHAGTRSNDELRIERVEVIGKPFFFETAPLELALTATDAVLAIAAGEGNVSLLTLARVAHGEVIVEGEHANLEALARALIVPLAAQQGVDVQGVQLELISRGPRSIDFRVEIVAKMLVMTARAAVSGRLDITDELNGRLSQLTCSGHGLMAGAAAAFIKPHLAKLDGRTIPLLALPLGEIKVRDIAVAVGPRLRLDAQFGA